ncbi:MAG: VIT and VWA domain-containing protein [Phycisphaerae bacterium]|jgi:hypothetical protein|nr:VIT and VWA domain-containing protein [Phycisphaerae bacterium]
MHTTSNRKYCLIVAAIAIVALQAGMVRGETEVALQSHSERVEIVGRVATTTVSQTYVNYTNFNQEVVMRFRLPPGSAVSELAMWVEGLRSPGVFHPRIAAKRIYREIRNAGRDPAVLEYLGADAWRLSVFPILPKKTQKIEFKFTSVLPGRGGDCVYRSMKLLGGTFNQAADFEFAATLRNSTGIKDVKAISDALGVQRLKDRIELGFRTDNRKLDEPAAFAFTPKVKPSGVVAFNAVDGKKYYAAALDSPWDAPKPESLGRSIVIVLDASASMKGNSFSIAATVVKTILNDLTDKDKFNVIVAGSDVGLFNKNLPTASKDNRIKAMKWLAGFTPKGGTDLAAALRAVESLNKDIKTTLNVFLISDSEDCVGARQAGKELSPFLSDKDKLPNRPPANCRFFVCQVNSDSYILEYLAESTGGASGYVGHDNPKKDVEIVKSLLQDTRIPDPVTKVTLRQIVAGDSKRAKGRADLTDIGFSRPDPVSGMVVTGLWPGPGKRTIEVTLHRRTGTQTARYTLDFPKGGDLLPNARGLRKVWAHQRADGMWPKLHRKDVKLDEVRTFMNFSRAEGIVTRAMALLVLESDEDYIERGIKRPGSSVTVKKSLAQRSVSKLVTEVVKAPREEWDRFGTIDPNDRQVATQQARELLRRGHIEAAARLFEEAADSASGQFEARRQASLIGEYLALKSSFGADKIVRKSYDEVLNAVLKGGEWHELVMQTEATGLILQDPNAKPLAAPPAAETPARVLLSGNKPAIQERLDDKILARKIPKISMKNATLKAVLAKLGSTKENFEVRWDKLADEGIKPSTTISLVMTDATLDEALSSVMDKASRCARTKGKYDWLGGLDFTVDKSGITVSSQRDIGVNAHLRSYDIQDLIALSLDQNRRSLEIESTRRGGPGAQGSIRRSVPDDVFYVTVGDNSSGPVTSVALTSGSFSTSRDEPMLFELDDNPGRDGRWTEQASSSTGLFDPGAGGGDTGSGLEGDLRSMSECVGEISTLLTDTVDRDSWREAGGEAGAINEVNGVLMILQTRANHKAIAKLLDNLRQTWLKRRPIKIAPIPWDGEPPRIEDQPEDPFNAKGRIKQWVIDLLRKAAAGKLSKFSSVRVKKIGSRTFARICGVWFDTSLTGGCQMHAVATDSGAHAALLKTDTTIEKCLALGRYVIVKTDDASAIYLNRDGISRADDKQLKQILASLAKR